MSRLTCLYQTNLDWAGLHVERVSGLTLDQYFKKNIFAQLGVTNASFFPDEEMRSNLAHMNQRLPDGKVIGQEHLNHRPINANPEEQSSIFCSGGAGLFTKPTEYLSLSLLKLTLTF